MEYTTDDLREEALHCLRTEVSNLFQRQSKYIKFDRMTLNNLHYQLALSLVRLINSDDEPMVIKQIENYVQLQNQYEYLQNVLRHERQAAEEEVKRAHLDNLKLQKNFDQLEKELLELQFQHKKRSDLLRSKINAEFMGVQNNMTLSGKGRQMCSGSQKSLNQIRQDYMKFAQSLSNEMQSAKRKLLQYVRSSLKQMQNEEFQKSDYNIKKRQYDETKARQAQLRRQYTAAASALNRTLNISLPTQFSSAMKVDDMLRFVRDRYDAQVQSEINNVKNELKSLWPEMHFEGYNINDAFNEYLRRTIELKEQECQKILTRSAKREKKLKDKLAETLADLKQLQSRSFADSSKIISEINSLKNSYNNQQSTLDQKVMLLTERIRSPSSSSSFSFSPTKGSP